MQLPEGHVRGTALLLNLFCCGWCAVIKLLLMECLVGQIFVISLTGFRALLSRSHLLQTDRHAGSSPDGVDLGQITQISPCHRSLLRFTSAVFE